MTSESGRDVQLLKAYVFGATTLVIVLAVTALRHPAQKPRFGEIDVERMNVVEKDGTLRMVIANKARFPGLIVRGKEYPYPRGVAGMLLLNDEGSEYGSLTTRGMRETAAFSAFAGLIFGGGEAGPEVGMVYDDANGRREAGLHVWDRSDRSLSRATEQGRATQRMPDGPAKARAMAELRRSTGVGRVLVGKTPDSAAAIVLSDPQGKPRLRLVVDARGVPRLDFLDQGGRVTRTLTDSAEPPPRPRP